MYVGVVVVNVASKSSVRKAQNFFSFELYSSRSGRPLFSFLLHEALGSFDFSKDLSHHVPYAPAFKQREAKI
jgi:hypothetical protein